MPGEDQASAVLDGWIDAQRRMWDAWAQAARSAASSGEEDEPTDAAAVEEWRVLVNVALKAWAEEVVPLAQAAGESIAHGSERMVEMLELSMRAWRAMFPGADPGDWQGAAGQYVDQLSKLLLQAPGQATQMVELWRLSFEELARLQRTWLEEFLDTPSSLTGDGTAEPTVLRTFNDRYWDTWERTFGRLLESPDVGHTRELTQTSTQAMRAWVRFRRAATEYQLVLADALGRAWSAFVADLVSRIEAGEPPQTAGEVLRLWGKTADRVLTELFAQESYARAQGQLLNTAMAYRRAEREVVDRFLQMSHIPSRSELDEANRAIFELKRQVRDLQKAVKQLAAAPKPTPEPKATEASTEPKATEASTAPKGTKASRAPAKAAPKAAPKEGTST